MTPSETTAGSDALRWYCRFVLIAVVLSAASCLALLLPGDAVRADTGTTDGCVIAATVRATSFAAVLGDTRPIQTGFAERSCRAR